MSARQKSFRQSAVYFLQALPPFVQPGQPQPHPPPEAFRFFTAKRIQSARSARIRTPIPPSYPPRSANTANAASHATQHCERAMIPARTGDPTSRRMAAMAATQGV